MGLFDRTQNSLVDLLNDLKQNPEQIAALAKDQVIRYHQDGTLAQLGLLIESGDIGNLLEEIILPQLNIAFAEVMGNAANTDEYQSIINQLAVAITANVEQSLHSS